MASIIGSIRRADRSEKPGPSVEGRGPSANPPLVTHQSALSTQHSRTTTRNTALRTQHPYTQLTKLGPRPSSLGPILSPRHSKMRKLAITLILLAAVIASVAAYFVSTTPTSGAGVRFPLSAAHPALIASVPAAAESFTLVPTAAALDARLRANPITRAPLEDWESHQILPSPWMIGGARPLPWRPRKDTQYP